MGWKSYDIDRRAQQLVLQNRDKPDVLNESYKMREAVAYGLERFWGEHLRLKVNGVKEEKNKAYYWQATWESLVEVLAEAGIKLPQGSVDPKRTEQIQQVTDELWALELQDQRVALAVLTQLCDCLVWWTQRYKLKKEKVGNVQDS